MDSSLSDPKRKEEVKGIDIHKLFTHYDVLYFDGVLSACTISWSSTTSSLYAGIYNYQEGTCDIRLFELLEAHSSADIKRTVLHEMIHAYLWVKNDQKGRSDHGPSFQELMKKINSSTVNDCERPDGGYNITTSHVFPKGDNSKRDNARNHSSQSRGLKDGTNPSSTKYVTRRSANKAKAKESRSPRQIEKFLAVMDDRDQEFVDSFPPCIKDGGKRKEHVESTNKRSRGAERQTINFRRSNGDSCSHPIVEEEEDVDPEPLVNMRSERNQGNKRSHVAESISNYGRRSNGDSCFHPIVNEEEDDVDREPLVNMRSERRKLERMLRDDGGGLTIF